MPRLYGRKGFSRRKTIKQILEPYETQLLPGSEIIDIVDLPSEKAAELLALLPEAQRDDRVQADALTLAELVELASSIPGAVLSGFRIAETSPNERVTLTRVSIPYRHDLDHKLVDRLAAGIGDASLVVVGPDGSIHAGWSGAAQ
jgi:hypothetical protein